MGSSTDLHLGGPGFESSWWTDFFFKYHYFLPTRFFSTSTLIALLLGIPSMHRNGTWVKLNAHHLETQLWWLLMDIYFHSFFTVRWRHWSSQKIGNSCGTFLSKPRRQTVINQLSCGLNPSPSQTFFSVSWSFYSMFFFQWPQLFEVLYWYLDNFLAQLSVGH